MTTAETQHIYVRLPNWVGDVVMAEPCLRAIRQQFPDAKIFAHGKKHTFSFLNPGNLVDEQIPLQRTKGVLWPIKEGQRLKTLLPEIDLAVILPNSLSSALIAYTLGAKKRIGYQLNGRSLLLTQGLKAKKVGRLRPTPMVSYYLKLAETAGANTTSIKHTPILKSSEPAREAVAEFWQKHSLGERPIWALNLGGAWPSKRFPVDKSVDLCRHIINQGKTVCLLAGPDELDMATAISTQVNSDQLIGAPTTIFPLDQLIALLQRCDLLISTDSGPRHFGVAAQIPTLAIIGSTHPGYTGVDFEASETVCLEVDCWPCHKKDCPLAPPDFHKCLKNMEIERIFKRAEDLLSRINA